MRMAASMQARCRGEAAGVCGALVCRTEAAMGPKPAVWQAAQGRAVPQPAWWPRGSLPAAKPAEAPDVWVCQASDRQDAFSARASPAGRFLELWPRLRVLARCSPADKYTIVTGAGRGCSRLRLVVSRRAHCPAARTSA